MKELKLIELPLLGEENPPYKQRRMTREEMKREDIDRKKLYLIRFSGIWLVGRFGMQWYGWNFQPNLGSMSVQVNDCEAIYEIVGLDQEEDGSTGGFIASYLG